MATATLSVRIDAEVKSELDQFCRQVGMSTSTAISLFAHNVVRTQRLPFEVETNAITLTELQRRSDNLKAGRNVTVKSMEELEEMAR